MRLRVYEGTRARDGLWGPVIAFGAVAALCVLAATATAAAAAKRSAQHLIATPATIPLRTAFFDRIFEGPEQATAFTMAKAASASYVRLEVPWQSIAPATPTSAFVATDPTSSEYNWMGIDATVENAAASGITPILDIVTTPDWAYDQRPSGGNAGSPNIADLGDFAVALATHYDGLTLGLPAERVFQVWNESNNSLDLSPASGSTYRAMVNAVADAVHGVDPTNLVVAGSLDPFGHPKTKKQRWYSVAPLAFMRSLLCLSKGTHPHATCSDPVHFDVWSHHPYTFGGPFGHAKLPDDVELGDLPRMRALLHAGVRLHHVVSADPVEFWVTEFGWDTNPPRRRAASLNLAARWTSESLHQMWLFGISLVTWFLLEDYPSPSPYQSGFYFHSSSLATARAKPGLTAFRFPFVAYLQKKSVSVWGRDATSDKEILAIQRRHGKSGTWRTVAQVQSNASGIFVAKLKLKASKKDWLRAVTQDSDRSLAFSLTRPKDPHIGPWGN